MMVYLYIHPKETLIGATKEVHGQGMNLVMAAVEPEDTITLVIKAHLDLFV